MEVHDNFRYRQYVMLEHKVVNYVKLISFIRDLLGPVCRLTDKLTVTFGRLLSQMWQKVKFKNVKLSLSAPWKRTGATEVYCNSFLTSALDGREWSTPRPGKDLGTHWVEGRGAALDVLKQEKNFLPSGNQHPYCLTRSMVTILTQLSWLGVFDEKLLPFSLVPELVIRVDCMFH